MTTNTVTARQLLKLIDTQPIRVLVEDYPALMPILAQHGMDLCCGGGHTIAEAARLHDIETEPLINQVVVVISQARG